MKYRISVLLIVVLSVFFITPATAASLSMRDREFVKKAAQAGEAEIAGGQLASSKSPSADVRKFGDKMVQDHSKANDELKQIVQAKGLPFPEEPDANQQALQKRLENLDGNEFDRVYIKEAGIKDHKAAISLFDSEAKHGTDPDLKAYAERTLPIIKNHYQMARELEASHKLSDASH